MSTTKVWLASLWTAWLPCLACLIGGFDLLVEVLLWLMLLDYVSGLLVGFKDKSLNSARGYKGLRKKVMILAILCAATQFNRMVPNVELRAVVGLFYASLEVLSILENAGKLGIPIPKKLKRALEQIQEEEKREKDNNEKG